MGQQKEHAVGKSFRLQLRPEGKTAPIDVGVFGIWHNPRKSSIHNKAMQSYLE